MPDILIGFYKNNRFPILSVDSVIISIYIYRISYIGQNFPRYVYRIFGGDFKILYIGFRKKSTGMLKLRETSKHGLKHENFPPAASFHHLYAS